MFMLVFPDPRSRPRITPRVDFGEHLSHTKGVASVNCPSPGFPHALSSPTSQPLPSLVRGLATPEPRHTACRSFVTTLPSPLGDLADGHDSINLGN